MKILVLSDSHGNVRDMVTAVEREQPQMILHLGDCWRDAEKLSEEFPNIPMQHVPGNCDFRPGEELEKVIFVEDYRILICHGHTYGVKTTLLQAGFAAEEKNVDAFLFGHTHKPLVDMRGKTLFLNPGTMKSGYKPTYGVLTTDRGKLDGRIELFV